MKFEHGNTAGLRHGHTKRGWHSRTYASWMTMVQRCTNPKAPNWKYYGGRGIKVCDRWLESFENFLADMGDRPAHATLDRENTDGDYEPANCRLASWLKQVESRRSTKLTARVVRQIRLLAEMGYTKASVGRMYAVDASVVSKIAHGHRWRAA